MSSASLVRRFHLGLLERDRWTHEAHLAVGLWALVSARALHTTAAATKHAATDAALAGLRTALRAHNDCVGIPNNDTSGYHETITWFYLDRIARIVDETGIDAASVTRAQLDRLTGIVLADPRVSQDAARDAYGDQILASSEARSSVIAPPADHVLDPRLTTGQLTAAA